VTKLVEVDKIQTYCEELLGTDLVTPESAYGRKLKKALTMFKSGADGILAILSEMDDLELLPYDTAGSLPEPEEIIDLLKIRNMKWDYQ